ncbi:hypothetical protein JCM16418A_00080 [Paenibacillus pini]
MIPIFPLTQEHIRSHCGRMVRVCCHDGRSFFGILTDCRDGCIILDGKREPQKGHAQITKKQTKAGKKRRSSSTKTQSTSTTPALSGFGGGYASGLALGLTSVALLFLI